MPVESAGDRASFFSAEEFATPARYTQPGGGDPIDCSVVYDRGQARNRFEAGEMRAVTAERHAWINADEVALVERNGTLEVGTLDGDGNLVVSETLVIAAKPILDETGGCWSAELVLAA